MTFVLRVSKMMKIERSGQLPLSLKEMKSTTMVCTQMVPFTRFMEISMTLRYWWQIYIYIPSLKSTKKCRKLPVSARRLIKSSSPTGSANYPNIYNPTLHMTCSIVCVCGEGSRRFRSGECPQNSPFRERVCVVPYMIGKIYSNSTHSIKGLTKVIPGKDLSCYPLLTGRQV